MAGRLKSGLALLLALLLSIAPLAAPAAEAGNQAAGPPAAVQLLADAEYVRALLTTIRGASRSIDLVMFLWKPARDVVDDRPGEVIKALGEAGRRGVKVRVILENSGYDQGINKTNQKTARLLAGEGITAIFDSPAVTTHAKLAVVDGRYCFVGSHNLTSAALGRNHEVSLLLDDRRLAGELTSYADRLAATGEPFSKVRRVPGRSGPR